MKGALNCGTVCERVIVIWYDFCAHKAQHRGEWKNAIEREGWACELCTSAKKKKSLVGEVRSGAIMAYKSIKMFNI